MTRVLAITAVLLLAACTGDPGTGPRSGPSEAATSKSTAATSPRPAVPPEPPPPAACYRYAYDQLAMTSSAVPMLPLAPVTTTRMSAPCPRRAASHVAQRGTQQ